MKNSLFFKLLSPLPCRYNQGRKTKGDKTMDRTYSLNELAMMTGFTTRTLRSYLTQGLLHGSKVNGAWQFTPEDLDRFFSERFVREGLRIKRNSTVYDFLADRKKQSPRACVVLDLPASAEEGREISAFFCEQMNAAHDANFTFDRNGGVCRVILTGAQAQVAKIMEAYCKQTFGI
jgi:DNA-binding transcriptional MerR regulator